MSNIPPIIESASAEQMLVVWELPTDPTAGSIDFQVEAITGNRGSPSGTWVAGSWSGTYNATTKRVESLSPTIGAAGSLVVAEGSEYQLWARAGTVVKLAGKFRVR